MADTGQLTTQELSPSPADEHSKASALPQVTSVANPRRIRLTRLTQSSAHSD